MTLIPDILVGDAIFNSAHAYPQLLGVPFGRAPDHSKSVTGGFGLF
jgi:hypothetical protein